MTSSELFNLCLDHFSRSQWDPFYAQAEVDERWYTSEIAAALLRSGEYTFPAYQFGSEESFNTLAASLGIQLDHQAATKIPDLSLRRVDPAIELLLVVEAKVVRAVNSSNLSMSQGALGAQMEQAKEMFPTTDVYGLVIIELSPVFGQRSIPDDLVRDIGVHLAQLSPGTRSRLDELLAKWVRAGNRTTADVITREFDIVTQTAIGFNDQQILSDIHFHVQDAANKLQDRKQEAGASAKQIDGPSGKRWLEEVQKHCADAWAGHGDWVADGVRPVAAKMAMSATGGTTALGSLALGLWEWKA